MFVDFANKSNPFEHFLMAYCINVYGGQGMGMRARNIIMFYFM